MRIRGRPLVELAAVETDPYGRGVWQSADLPSRRLPSVRRQRTGRLDPQRTFFEIVKARSNSRCGTVDARDRWFRFYLTILASALQ